jgi:alpha-tubulin suppressor-like RCC1 family protein
VRGRRRSRGAEPPGDGTADDSLVPVAVAGLTNATGIASDRHACALRADGTAWCWGPNDRGQLGNGQEGEDAHSHVPVAVANW